MNKVLVFDLIGDYVHFRKYYTTTSPLTFLFPPRTAILGLIGAILGYEKDSWTETFAPEVCDIGIQIISPGRKGILKENWRKGPPKFSKRGFSWGEMQSISQIPLEVLRDARFRVYFSHGDRDQKIFSLLKKFIGEHKSKYTPYFGLSEFICDIQPYCKLEYDTESYPGCLPVEISTVIPQSLFRDEGDPIEYEREKEYFEVTVPNSVNKLRQFDYLKVFFEKNGKSVKAYLEEGAITISDLGINIVFLR